MKKEIEKIIFSVKTKNFVGEDIDNPDRLYTFTQLKDISSSLTALFITKIESIKNDCQPDKQRSAHYKIGCLVCISKLNQVIEELGKGTWNKEKRIWS